MNKVPFLCTKLFQKKEALFKGGGTLFKGGHFLRKYDTYLLLSILNFRKPQGKAADDYIPDVPDENAAAGVLPTEIRKLIEARKEVKKLLNNPNLTDDNLR